MPRSTREWAQRRLKDSLGNIDWAMTKLMDVAQIYQAEHPEIAGPLDEVMAAMVVLRDAIVTIRAAF